MNKLGLILCLAIPIVYSPHANAQVPDNSIHYYKENDNTFTSNVFLNEISSRAYKHFLKNYSFASNEVWRKSAAGFLVTFTASDSTLYHVYYERSGRFQTAYTYYQRGIPADIKESIKYNYKEYSVLSASGMNDGAKTIFDVSLIKDYMVRVVEITGREVRMINQYVIER